MSIRVALAGNPNCGKTTLFNSLTGSNQYVGNWPGVTVEKKEGKLKGEKDVTIVDLPGIYSLSPYTLEEVVSRNYILDEKPDVILNIVDGTNLERNLYLTTQLLETGVPVIIALNMIDVVNKQGDKIDIEKLSKELSVPIYSISALKNEGVDNMIKGLIKSVEDKSVKVPSPHVFTGSVEHALAHIEEQIEKKVSEENLRYYAIKVFERDEDTIKKLNIDKSDIEHMEGHIVDCEKEMDDESDSIITNQRYEYIANLMTAVLSKSAKAGDLTFSDKVDKILTHRIFALPIFAVIIFIVYSIAMGSLGSFLTDWTNEVFFGEIIQGNVSAFLESANVAPWVQSLVVDGIIGGVGTVLGFVPQMAILFLFLSILEDSGYMARVAFIFDRVFRKFGLSGKSFIPMLVGTGCGVPAIMATRTIEEERDRRMTIMLCTFMPCAAKMELVLMLTDIFFNGSSLVATLMYFLGIAIIVLSGIALKKLNYFSGDPAPFVMELPQYHLPSIKTILLHVWDRVKAFMIKAGTIIFAACVVLWFLMNFNFKLELVDLNESILKTIGEAIAFIFAPLGFGHWQGAVAAVSAEIAKEQASATLGMLAGSVNGEEGKAIYSLFNGSRASGLGFMLFNIFNAPCLVAIATAFREQGTAKWGWYTFIFQMLVGYVVAFIGYQISYVMYGGSVSISTYIAIFLILFILFMVFRTNPHKQK